MGDLYLFFFDPAKIFKYNSLSSTMHKPMKQQNIFFYSKHDANVGDEVCIRQSKVENTPASLVVQCLRSVVINMESMPRNEINYLPSPYQELVQPESFVETKFQLWPRYIRVESTTLMTKKDMIVGEILLLLRKKLQLGNDVEVRLFKNCLPLEEDDVIQEENGDYDCVFVPSKMPTNISDAARIGKSRDVIRTVRSNKDVSIAVFYSANCSRPIHSVLHKTRV